MNNDLNVKQIPPCTKCVNDEELDNLGPGCYVQVKDGESCFWVEITAINNEEFSGVLHCELGESICQPAKVSMGLETFNKKQIVNLGCDNYCWC